MKRPFTENIIQQTQRDFAPYFKEIDKIISHHLKIISSDLTELPKSEKDKEWNERCANHIQDLLNDLILRNTYKKCSEEHKLYLMNKKQHLIPEIPNKPTVVNESSIQVNDENTSTVHQYNENGIFDHLPYLPTFDPVSVQSVQQLSVDATNRITNNQNDPNN